MLEIVTIETPSLGDRTTLLISGSDAIVVDPQRDIDRIRFVLDARMLRLRYVFETHVHNDYVSGGLELARRMGATLVMPAQEPVVFEHQEAVDGDTFRFGDASIRAIDTPGHTPHHLSYVVSDADRPVAVCSGGSMLFGTVGRTDLIGADATESLTRAQFRSVRRIASELPGEVTVHPTHGFGSFCSSGSTSERSESTIAIERISNDALRTDDEDAFVARLLSGLTAYPTYYARMGPINRAGPAPIDLSPLPSIDDAEIRRRIDAGEWVVDLRPRDAFAARHVAGMINVELSDSFATYLGWTMPWETPLTLVAERAGDVAQAQRELARIGIDRPVAGNANGPGAWGDGSTLRTYPMATFTDLAAHLGDPEVVVLDVRRDDEWLQSRVVGAVHIPLFELEARIAEIPDGTVWVHCATGYRAAIAASLLDRAGRRVVVIDDVWPQDVSRLAVGVVGARVIR